MKYITCKASVPVGPDCTPDKTPEGHLHPLLFAALKPLKPEHGYTTRDVIRWATLTQPQFVESMAGMLSAARIDTAIRLDLDADVVVLDNEDHERLARAILEPRNGAFPFMPPHPLLPSLLEIRDASEKPPETP